MATNFVQDGDTITLAAPYDVASGHGAKVGHIFGVALQTLLSGVSGEFKTDGVWSLACLSTDTPAVGALIYWDDSNKRCTTTSTSNMLIGAATVAKLTGATVVVVRLNEVAV